MRETRTGLLRDKGKWAENCCRINEIRPYLVFRGTDQQCSHNANEISALRSELVFREVPGKLVQRGRQSQRLRCLCLCRSLINPPGDSVAWIPAAPTRLRSLTADCLALRLAAGPLPGSHSRARPEPPAADGARSLPGLWHRDVS